MLQRSLSGKRTGAGGGFARRPVIAAALLAAAAVQAAATATLSPSDAQIGELQSRVHTLIDEVEVLAQHPGEADSQRGAQENWEDIQTYLALIARLLPPGARPAPDMEVIAGSAACALPANLNVNDYVTPTRELLWKLLDQIGAAYQAQDSAGRQQRLRAQLQNAYPQLQGIRRSVWFGGKPAPGEHARPTVAEASSQGAYLVDAYCTQCHGAPPAEAHTAQEWSAAMSKMDVHMKLGAADNMRLPSERELALMQSYLQVHACRPVLAPD
jgi:hypothetical protein